MFIKNKKGFSLLEVLVTMGIVTVLAGIAIPAYNRYKQGVKDTAVKSDVSNASKAYLAYDATYNTFCVSLSDAGLSAFGDSDIYTGAGVNSFMGFDHPLTGCTGVTLGSNDVQKTAGSGVGGATCELEAASFKMGAGFKKGDKSVGYNITNTSSAPKATAGGTCSDSSKTSSTTCTGNWDDDADSNTPDVARVWTASIADVCA